MFPETGLQFANETLIDFECQWGHLILATVLPRINTTKHGNAFNAVPFTNKVGTTNFTMGLHRLLWEARLQ